MASPFPVGLPIVRVMEPARDARNAIAIHLMPRRITKAEREASPMLDYMVMNGIGLSGHVHARHDRGQNRSRTEI